MRVSMLVVALAAVVLGAGSAMADTDVTITGQVRARTEISDKSFDTLVKVQQFTYLRTRVMADARINNNTHAVAQFQDSRILGDNGYSGSLSDAKNVDLHQAYLQVDHLWNNGVGFKAGRFEVNLGNQRVFGAVGWHNVGRSWEGFQTWLDREKVRFDAFWLKKMELNATTGNTDFDIFGAQATIKSINLDLFGFFEHDAFQDDSTLITNAPIGTFYSQHKRLQRLNLGLYYKRIYQQFDFELNSVYQTGQKQIWTEPVTDRLVSEELDIAAFMFAFETGYTFDRPCRPRLAMGIDYTSGDDDAADDKYEAYDNLYYTGHKFRGFMDYFPASPKPGGTGQDVGLMDVMLRLKANPTAGWTVKGDFHFFKTATDYVDPMDTTGATMTKDIGMEFDIGIVTSRVAGVKLAAGASLFLPTESYAGMADPDPRFWSYLQATAGF